MLGVSLLMPSFKRPHLLRLGLYSISRQPIKYNLEILVLNDGVEDDTEKVCKEFPSLNIRYIFTGQRNKGSIIKRVPGFALNIGFKLCSHDIIILSCPEMFHLNDTINILIDNLIQNQKSMVIPDFIYFDKTQETTNALVANRDSFIDRDTLTGNEFGRTHGEMPYLLALYKEHLFRIGGYCEKMIGYAGDDNSLILRLKRVGLNYIRVPARAIHLWHEGTNDGNCHWDNPAWVYNWNILQKQVNDPNLIIVNLDCVWGVLENK